MKMLRRSNGSIILLGVQRRQCGKWEAVVRRKDCGVKVGQGDKIIEVIEGKESMGWDAVRWEKNDKWKVQLQGEEGGKWEST